MKRIQIKHSSGRIVHFQNPISVDFTLCSLHWVENDCDRCIGSLTTRTVTCERCQRIVAACKGVVISEEISNISR